MLKRLEKRRVMAFLLLALPLVLFITLSVVNVQASEWIEETVGSTSHQYDKYSYWNYSLDFYVDTAGGWLPWNWGEGIAKGAYHILYFLTNLIWMVIVMFSYFVGWIVQKVYDVDFISDSISYVSKNIQKISGISSSGLSSRGFLSGFILILIIVAGLYFLYLAFVKQSMSRAVSTLTAFIVTLVMGMGIIAYAPNYIGMVNDFQKGINQEMLSISGSIMTDGEGGEGSVSSFRDSLFNVMIYKPYLLLQYGSADESEIGKERIASLLELSPSDDAEEREEVTKQEVVDYENNNMSVPKVLNRLGMVCILLLVVLIIAFCVSIFAAMMLLSQCLFLLYVSFLPIPFVLSLFPHSSKLLTQALGQVFNVIFLKTGVTIILTIVFSISAMCYSLSADGGLLWMMFLQVVVFVGALVKSQKLLGLMRVGSNDAEQIQGRMRSGVNTVANLIMMKKLFGNSKKSSDSSSGSGEGADTGKTSGNKAGTAGAAGAWNRKRNSGAAGAYAMDRVRDRVNLAVLERQKNRAENLLEAGTESPALPGSTAKEQAAQHRKYQRSQQIDEMRNHAGVETGAEGVNGVMPEAENASVRKAMQEKKDYTKTETAARETAGTGTVRRAETYKKGSVSRGQGKATFHNFKGRDYNMSELEKRLLDL